MSRVIGRDKMCMCCWAFLGRVKGGQGNLSYAKEWNERTTEEIQSVIMHALPSCMPISALEWRTNPAMLCWCEIYVEDLCPALVKNRQIKLVHSKTRRNIRWGFMPKMLRVLVGRLLAGKEATSSFWPERSGCAWAYRYDVKQKE